MELQGLLRDNSLLFSIVLFLALFFSITKMKPSILFKHDGSIREFGLNSSNKTIIPIWLFTICIAILSYIGIQYYVL